MSRLTVGLALVLVAACGLALWLSPRDPQPPARWRPERIILFTVDTLRADELGLYGFDELDVSPHLDRWAQDAIVFDRASSQAPWTVPSLAAFLTGRFGSEMGVYTNETGIPQGWATLAETLRDAGYRTAAFNSHSLLLEDEMGFRRGFDEVFPRASAPILEGEHKMPFAAVEPDLDRWLDEHSTDHFFIWIHDMDPHSPKTPGNPYLANSDWHRYDAEVRWVDDTFGRILARLQSAGVWDDDFLFVFTADHGEAFGDHGLLGHQNVMYDEVLRVPLLIQYSAMKGPMRISDPVDLFDVRRTILDLAGVPDPTGRQGESLLPLMEGIRKERGRRFSVHSRHYFEDGHHEYAIRDRVWKLIVRTPPSEDRLGEGVPTWLVGREGTRVELYNLVVDPGEGEDVAATHPEIVEYLLNALDDWDKSLSKPERRAPRLDEEDLEILERLGYNPSSDS